MSDEPRRPSNSHQTQDPPSGRFDRERERPSRQSELELAAANLAGRIAQAEQRITSLEVAAREHTGDSRMTRDQLAGLHREFAVAVTKLDAIEASISRMEAQRSASGANARDITRTIISVVTALAAIISLVVALATR